MADDFSPFLAPRETIRWSGQPAQGIVFRARDLFVVPFSILWCGFLIFWESMAVRGGPSFFVIWGIPFIAVGLYMVVGRFFADAIARARTHYALTERRALILGGLFTTSLTSVDLSTLSELHYKPGSDGRGTIVFGPDTGGTAFGFGRRYSVASPEFFRVPEAATAYALIQRQRASA